MSAFGLVRTAALWVSLAAAGEPGEAIDPTTAALADEHAGIPGLPPGPVPAAAEVDRQAHAIGARLRCPVCQGLSVADSTSSAAVMMQRRVHELVAQGYDQGDIEEYFISKYGEWILLDPRSEGLNQLVWIGPVLVAAVGLLIAATFLRPGASPPAPPPPASDDPWTRRLLDEVDHD